jgi:hypothetical protein
MENIDQAMNTCFCHIHLYFSSHSYKSLHVWKFFFPAVAALIRVNMVLTCVELKKVLLKMLLLSFRLPYRKITFDFPGPLMKTKSFNSSLFSDIAVSIAHRETRRPMQSRLCLTFYG